MILHHRLHSARPRRLTYQNIKSEGYDEPRGPAQDTDRCRQISSQGVPTPLFPLALPHPPPPPLSPLPPARAHNSLAPGNGTGIHEPIFRLTPCRHVRSRSLSRILSPCLPHSLSAGQVLHTKYPHFIAASQAVAALQEVTPRMPADLLTQCARLWACAHVCKSVCVVMCVLPPHVSSKKAPWQRADEAAKQGTRATAPGPRRA